MRMEEGLDTGPYCSAVSIEIGDMHAGELTAQLAELGATLLLETLDRIESGTCEWIAQDESAVTYAAKLSKDDVVLSPDISVAEALRRIRASGAQAPARVLTDGRGITVISATRVGDVLPPGSAACTKSAFLLGFSDGTLAVRRAKPDGKCEMEGCDWARGSRLPEGAVWTAAR
jgi:methionyl-tRNA formyltransferase